MRFRYMIVVYLAVWIFLIAGVCIYEWNVLEQFQFSYEDEEIRKAIRQEMKAGEYNSKQEQIVETADKDVESKVCDFAIIADSTMTIYVNQVRQKPQIQEETEDKIYEDISELLGKEIKKCIYLVAADSVEDITVTDAKGNIITPQENDFVKGSYYYDLELADIAIHKFEYYLKHISGLVTFDELTAVMRTDSKAYKAVRASQQSLEWMIKAKSMEFTKEEVTDMQIFDENHFACDVTIELKKITDTERERTVEETVKYRVLYEKMNSEWFIYSFVTK